MLDELALLGAVREDAGQRVLGVQKEVQGRDMRILHHVYRHTKHLLSSCELFLEWYLTFRVILLRRLVVRCEHDVHIVSAGTKNLRISLICSLSLLERRKRYRDWCSSRPRQINHP